MDIKCPKCRLRFDVTVSAGVNEVAAVCPRCGTPFTYEVPDDAVKTERMSSQTETVTPAPEKHETDANSRQSNANNSAARHATNTASTTAPNDDTWQQRLKSTIQGPPNMPYEQRRSVLNSILMEPTIRPRQPQRRKGCMPTGCGCLSIVLFALLLYSAYVFMTTNSYTSEGIADELSLVEQEVASGKTLDDQDKETPPEWLEGTWEVKTSTGKIKIFIRGDKISELSGNDENGFETSHGSFYYSKGILYCTFEDADIEELRRIDTKRKRIDAGDGLWMTKISNNI